MEQGDGASSALPARKLEDDGQVELLATRGTSMSLETLSAGGYRTFSIRRSPAPARNQGCNGSS
jgi:hypothetical protein